MAERFYKKIEFLIPVLIGILIFFYVCGPRCLNPENIAWLYDGDSAQHYLGWAFFRNSPWSFPLGLNPDWGLENSSSIIYADALPALSILIKSFNSLLPDVFQFYGYWFLICFILQAYFSWRLFSIFNLRIALKIVGTIFFTLSPIIFFMRIGGHQSLAAHFLILWCICLYYGNLGRRNTIEWMVCLGLSVACHPYFTVMCLMIFGAFVCKEIFKKKECNTFYYLSFLSFFCLLSIIIVAWQIGLFVDSASPSSDPGYGFYKFNLIGLFNPLGTSFFLKNHAVGGGDYEGFSYLGFGLLLFIFVVLILDGINGFKNSIKFLFQNWPLCVFLCALLMISISNNISFGSWKAELYSVKVDSYLQTFRATGRFIWPIWYFLGLYALVVFQNLINEHLIPYKFATFLLLVFISFQFVDFHEYIQKNVRKALMNNNAMQWGIQSNEWIALRKKYSQIRLLNNPGLRYSKWRELSLIAANNKMKTNVFYLARSDSRILAERKRVDKALLENKNFDKKTIYVLSDKEALAIKNNLKDKQVLTKLDGFNLLLPDGF